jgi:hypothetical protein
MKYFLNDYLGGAKVEKMKTLYFTGCKIVASESSVYKSLYICVLSVLFVRLKSLYI